MLWLRARKLAQSQFQKISRVISGKGADRVRVMSTRARFVSQILITLSALLMISGTSAQSVADNIRPVSQVCVAGQACVGSPAGGAIEAPAEAAAVAQESTQAEEPAPAEPAAIETAAAESDFDVAGQYQMSCFACHASGAAGAPLLGDAEAWNARLEKGMDAVMANVINGLNAMPARGLCMDCTDDNLQALVDYMVSQ